MNLRLWVISRAWYDDEGVGYSKLMEHFPHVIGPDVLYDTLTDLRKPWGRHPVTGDPLIVMGCDRYTSTVVTPGVMSHSARLTPHDGTVPAVTVTECVVYDYPTAQAIHAHAQHLILALEVVNSDDDPPIAGWGKDDTFAPALWTQIRNGLVTLGMDSQTIDNWRTVNPDATRREFYFALSNFIQRQAP